MPEAAFVDAGHQFQPSLGQVEPLVEWGEAFFQLQAGQNPGREGGRYGVEMDVLEAHGRGRGKGNAAREGGKGIM